MIADTEITSLIIDNEHARTIEANAERLGFADDTHFILFSFYLSHLIAEIFEEKRQLFITKPDGSETRIPLAQLIASCGGETHNSLESDSPPSGDDLLASILALDPNRSTDFFDVHHEKPDPVDDADPTIFYASQRLVKALQTGAETLGLPDVGAYVSFSLMMSGFVATLIARDQGLTSKNRYGFNETAIDLEQDIAHFGGDVTAMKQHKPNQGHLDFLPHDPNQSSEGPGFA